MQSNKSRKPKYPFNRRKMVKHLKDRLGVDGVEENVDILIFLDFEAFLHRIAKKSDYNKVKPKHIDDALKDVLPEFRG